MPLADMRIEGEATDHQRVEHVARLAGGVTYEVGADGAVFRADDDGGPLRSPFSSYSPSAEMRALPGQGFRRGEGQALVLAGVLHAGGAEISRGGGEVGLCFGDAKRGRGGVGFAGFFPDCGEQGCVIFAGGEGAVG